MKTIFSENISVTTLSQNRTYWTDWMSDKSLASSPQTSLPLWFERIDGPGACSGLYLCLGGGVREHAGPQVGPPRQPGRPLREGPPGGDEVLAQGQQGQVLPSSQAGLGVV